MSVSFLIPVRDGAATIEAALRSVLAQTVSDFDVVVVDDGSRDDTVAIVSAIAEQDARVSLIARPAAGIAAALNAGIAACRSEWVARMDADDLCAADRLARQQPHLDEPELGVVDGRVSFFRDGGDAIPEGMLRYERWINSVIEPEDFDRHLLIESPVVHPAATLRRSAVLAVGGYRDGPFPEDYDLWARLHAAGWRLRKVPAVLVQMRDRPQRLTRTDPRYGRAGLRAVRQAWLAEKRLTATTRVVIVGAGDEATQWIRWLRAGGHAIAAVVDVAPRRIGGTKGGAPVIPPKDLAEIDAGLCLVAVGAWGAREEALSVVRATGRWTEGRDAFAVC